MIVGWFWRRSCIKILFSHLCMLSLCIRTTYNLHACMHMQYSIFNTVLYHIKDFGHTPRFLGTSRKFSYTPPPISLHPYPTHYPPHPPHTTHRNPTLVYPAPNFNSIFSVFHFSSPPHLPQTPTPSIRIVTQPRTETPQSSHRTLIGLPTSSVTTDISLTWMTPFQSLPPQSKTYWIIWMILNLPVTLFTTSVYSPPSIINHHNFHRLPKTPTPKVLLPIIYVFIFIKKSQPIRGQL